MNEPARTIKAVDRAISELRRGLPVLVTEPDGIGALVMAAELVTDRGISDLKEMGGGEASLVLTLERAITLKIRPSFGTTVRIPLETRMTPGVIQSLADPVLDLASPMRGPFERAREPDQPTNVAGIKLAKLARLLPTIVATAPMSPAEATRTAERHDLLQVNTDAILEYETVSATRLEEIVHARVPLSAAENSRIHAFRPDDGGPEHFAILINDPPRNKPVLARIHSECFTGDLLGSLKCDCGDQLRGAIEQIGEAGGGLLIYLSQEGRGIGLINKLRAYELQDQGFDTVEANERLGFEADERIFLPAVEILRSLGFGAVRLLTNNPDKVEALEGYGVEVAERVAHSFPTNEHNAFYLSTKAKKSGHLL